MTRKEAIEFLKNMIDRESIGFVCPKGDGDVAVWEYHVTALNMAIKALEQPEPCEDAVSRQAIIKTLNEMDRYVSEELRLCDTDKKFPKNEVFIVDDVYEKIVENLPSTQPEPSTEIQEILDYLDATLHPIVSSDNWNVYAELHDMVSKLPSAEPLMQGWVCPVCGRGLSPFTSVCPCKSGKGWEITC